MWSGSRGSGRRATQPSFPLTRSALTCRPAGDHRHRPEQARRQQGRVSLVRLDVGEGVLLRCVRLLIADEPIDPGIGHLDCQFDCCRASARRSRPRDRARARRCPSGLPLTVTFARFFTSPRSIHDVRALAEPGCRRIDGFGVGAGSGEVLHAGVGVIAPRRERVERDGGRRAPVGREGHRPGSGDRRASCVSAGSGTVCEVSLVGLRKTTKTVPHGSSLQRHGGAAVGDVERHRLGLAGLRIPEFRRLAGSRGRSPPPAASLSLRLSTK